MQGVDGVYSPREALVDLSLVGGLSADDEFDVVSVVVAVGPVENSVPGGGKRTIVLTSKDGKLLYVQLDTAALTVPFDLSKALGTVVGAKNLTRPYINPSTGALW